MMSPEPQQRDRKFMNFSASAALRSLVDEGKHGNALNLTAESIDSLSHRFQLISSFAIIFHRFHHPERLQRADHRIFMPWRELHGAI